MFAPVSQVIPKLGTSGPTVNYQGLNPFGGNPTVNYQGLNPFGGPTTQPITNYRPMPSWGTSGPIVDPRSPEQITSQRNQTLGNVVGGLGRLPGVPGPMRFAGDALQYLLQSGALNPVVMR